MKKFRLKQKVKDILAAIAFVTFIDAIFVFSLFYGDLRHNQIAQKNADVVATQSANITR